MACMGVFGLQSEQNLRHLVFCVAGRNDTNEAGFFDDLLNKLFCINTIHSAGLLPNAGLRELNNLWRSIIYSSTQFCKAAIILFAWSVLDILNLDFC